MTLEIFSLYKHVLAKLFEYTMCLTCIYEYVYATIMNLKKWQSFAKSARVFEQGPWNFLDTVFLASMWKKRCKNKSAWCKQKPSSWAINSCSQNLRITPEKYFRFHWSCKQPRVEARNSMLICDIYFALFS